MNHNAPLRRFCVATALSTLTAVAAGAEKLAVETMSGQRHLFEVSDNLVWRLSQGSLLVGDTGGQTVDFEIADVKTLEYGNFSVIENTVSSTARFILSTDAIVIETPTPALLTVFDAAGRQIVSRHVDQTLRLPLADYPVGIYLARLGDSQTFKFSVK